MEHEIKKLADAVESIRAKKIIENHVKALHFENKHLTVYVDNAHPLHEIKDEKMDHHMRVGMEKVYGPDITYEFKIHKPHSVHEREKAIGHDRNLNVKRDV